MLKDLINFREGRAYIGRLIDSHLEFDKTRVIDDIGGNRVYRSLDTAIKKVTRELVRDGCDKFICVS